MSIGKCFWDDPARYGCQPENDQYDRDRDDDSSIHTWISNVEN